MSKSKLALGTAQFGLKYGISNKNGKTSSNEVTRILEVAASNGLEVLDTASGYGSAEEVLGKNNLQIFKVISKYLPSANSSFIEQELRNSLERLNISTLYGYLAHRPTFLLNNHRNWHELEGLREKGLVQKIGFSLYNPNELEKLLDLGFYPDIIQVPYNYFDTRFEDLIKVLKSGGTEIHTRSTFLQGLFFVKPDDLPDYFDEIKPYLAYLQEYASLPGMLLKYVLDKPFIDKVVLGVENSQQLKYNIDSTTNLKNTLPKLNCEISNNILNPSLWPI